MKFHKLSYLFCLGLNHIKNYIIHINIYLDSEEKCHSVSVIKDCREIGIKFKEIFCKYFVKYVKTKEKTGVSESNRILRMYETTKQNFYAPSRLEMKNYIHTFTVKQRELPRITKLNRLQ